MVELPRQRLVRRAWQVGTQIGRPGVEYRPPMTNSIGCLPKRQANLPCQSRSVNDFFNKPLREISTMLYLISYDLMAPGKDYKPLWAALAAIQAVRILDSQWLTRRTNTTPLGLADYCLRHMDRNDRIFVTEVPDNFAYRTLMAEPSAA